jgi:phosphoenolpyruvate carboxylase
MHHPAAGNDNQTPTTPSPAVSEASIALETAVRESTGLSSLDADVDLLSRTLDRVIADLAGDDAHAILMMIRRLAFDRRQGSPDAERRLADAIASLDDSAARNVARALSIFFDLANIAEDHQRIRVLRERERARHPQPLSESLSAAIGQLRKEGHSAGEVQTALDRLSIELVFTAHPSEAKRRSIRSKLRRIRSCLATLDRADLLPRERNRLLVEIASELRVLWQTEFLKPSKPTVADEVARGLSILPRLREVVPQVCRSMRHALAAHFPGHDFRIPTFLTFGSWMGGDRDGNPYVTAEVTAETLCRLRAAAIEMHLEECRRLYDYLTVSLTCTPGAESLAGRLSDLQQRWPELVPVVCEVPPHEAYRRWLRMIRWRLEQSRTSSLDEPSRPGDYGSGGELEADVVAICEALATDHDAGILDGDAGRWLDLVRTFGLRVTRLDIRQDARRYEEITGDIFRACGITTEGDAGVGEVRRRQLLDTMGRLPEIPLDRLQPLSRDTLALYGILRQAVERFGPNCLGGSIISLTQSPLDVLTVLWLWRHVCRGADPSVSTALRIVPLFEKIGDLRRSDTTLTEMLAEPAYAEHLAAQDSRQLVMVGYSDSTKDGGYLSACWGLYDAQRRIATAAEARDVHVTFFHGRGGSLGRGGGPAARGILSLPPESLDGTLRLTEQGEVLAERYDDVQIAFRHLEQVSWATLVGSTIHPADPSAEWLETAERLAARSFTVYRELVEQPGFIAFFSQATPIDEIENLPIGSRPARRRGERSLDDLRAIPWVFAWTQNRCLIPAWYGLGTAILEVKYDDRTAWERLREMYRRWPFFTATIDNAALALAKTDIAIGQRYSELVTDDDIRRRLWQLLAAECDRSRQAVLDITGSRELLEATPWLKRSIDARNPLIDPLNLIQVEFLERRERSVDDPSGSLREILRLSVQGIASGMRTTG